MKHFLSFFCLMQFIACCQVWGQTFNLSGKLVSAPDSKPICNIRVHLHPLSETDTLFGADTNKDGDFQWNALKPQRYHLRIHSPYFQEIDTVIDWKNDRNINLGIIRLERSAQGQEPGGCDCQESVNAPKVKSSKKAYKLTGRIVSKENKTPVETYIMLIPKDNSPKIGGRTGKNGHFMWKELDAREYTLQIRAKGFRPANIPIKWENNRNMKLGIIYLLPN